MGEHSHEWAMAEHSKAPLLAHDNYAGMSSAPAPHSALPVATGAIQLTCAVCSNIYHVINSAIGTCPRCSEKTPVGPPPPGKQYTRCVCNCLLIHNAGASAISCPRETCKRTTILGPPPKGKARGVCPHCEKLMQWPERAKGIVRCPKCRHAAAVSHSFLRGRFLLHFVIGLILLGTGIGVTVATLEEAFAHGGFYIVMYGPIVAGFLQLVVSLVYLYRSVTLPLVGPDPFYAASPKV